MQEPVFVEHFEGYDIKLSLPSGTFTAVFDEETLEEEALSTLRKRLTLLKKKTNEHSRVAQTPVKVMIYVESHRSGAIGSCAVFEVKGIVAGRTYSKQLRTDTGLVYVGDTVVCLHPDDVRVATLQGFLVAVHKAESAAKVARHDLTTCLKALPTFYVPHARSKEEALEKELAFLQELRDLQPMQVWKGLRRAHSC